MIYLVLAVAEVREERVVCKGRERFVEESACEELDLFSFILSAFSWLQHNNIRRYSLYYDPLCLSGE